MTWLSRPARSAKTSLLARALELRNPLSARLVSQHENGDGTVECRFSLSDGSAQYTLIVPSSNDGYLEMVRSNGAFSASVALICRLCSPGDTVFDFGANLGTVSIPLAVRGCNVYAFEILPENVRCLRRAASRHKGIRLDILHLAAWHSNAVVRVAGHSAWGRIDSAGQIEVEAAALDDFVRTRGVTRVDAIKIDVEGAELSALKGMYGVLGELKPDVVSEANALTCGANGCSIYDLFELLEHIGYHLYQIGDNLLIPFSRYDVQFLIVADYLATFRSESMLRRAYFRVGPCPPELLMGSMRSHAMAALEHRKYMAMQRNLLPCDLRNNDEFAALLQSWSDEPADHRLMSLLRVGARAIDAAQPYP